MKNIPLLTFFAISTAKNQCSIPKVKICKDCTYFSPVNRECTYFSDTNLVSGEKTYQYASLMRTSENKCGENAKHFEKNRFKIITVPYYYFVDFWPVLILPAFCITILFLK
jgi:hypothetical protein